MKPKRPFFFIISCLIGLNTIGQETKAVDSAMVIIPAGEFFMGKDSKKGYNFSPAHKVKVDSFLMDKHEVTNKEYIRFCKETGHKLPQFWNTDNFRSGENYPNYPVIGISCIDALKYAEWAGKRLPTEAEWEYAARGGLAEMEYPNGNNWTKEKAKQNSIGWNNLLSPVEGYEPNGFGLYDMAGNVWEWVSDRYSEEYYKVSELENPKGPKKGVNRVIRGGGWLSGSMCKKVYYRKGLPNNWCDFAVGFRCVKDINSTQESQVSTQTSLTEWQNQKFSMFIHWGLYSIPAGVWNGEKIKGYSEQIKGHGKIATEDYHKLTAQFNPMQWNPDSVALLAKEAGMKSIVITSKHHDGFSIFDTKYSEFNVVDATPYKRDVIKELSEACKRHELGFGVYFSLIDWDYPGAMPFTSTRNSDSIPPLHHKYNLNQVEELLTNYGEISEIWFDMGSPTYEQSKEIADLVKKIQPNCLVSGRLWNDQGDFVVMGDNYRPNFKMGVPWQTPASMFDETWSYRSWQERGDVNEKIKEKIHDLLKIVSMGGNYLLNIGPTAEGVVIPFEKEVLKGIGKWLKENGNAVYGTAVSPIRKQEWGVITSKPGKLYLHVLDYPENNKLVFEGIDSDIKEIYPLTAKNLKLESSKENGNLIINLPDKVGINDYSTVIVVEYDNELLYTPDNILEANEKGEIMLTPDNSEKYHSFSGHDYYSNRPTIVKMSWNLLNKTKSKCKIEIVSTSGEELILTVNNKEYSISFEGNIMSSKSSKYKIEIEGVKLMPKAINAIELIRKDQSNPHKGIKVEDLKLTINMD